MMALTIILAVLSVLVSMVSAFFYSLINLKLLRDFKRLRQNLSIRWIIRIIALAVFDLFIITAPSIWFFISAAVPFVLFWGLSFALKTPKNIQKEESTDLDKITGERNDAFKFPGNNDLLVEQRLNR